MKELKAITQKIKVAKKAIKELNYFSRIDKKVANVAKNFLKKILNQAKK